MGKRTRILNYLIGFMAIATVAVIGAQTVKNNFQSKEGQASDACNVIKMAVAVWEPIYGADKIAGEKPYEANLSNGVWIVEGSLSSGLFGSVTHGGAAIAEIKEDNGTILRVSHGK